VTWLDWTRLNPARNLSIFATEPDLLTNLGIDDEEMPVTDIDDRALHIVPEDDDSVAGRLVPREARSKLRMTKMKMLQQSSKILLHREEEMRKHARCRS
jgi:hypothetical protein